jgi:O-antigen ligase
LVYQQKFPPYLEWAVPHPHNIFLTTWLYAGLVGFAGFLFILYWFFQGILPRTVRGSKSTLITSGVALILMYMIIHGSIDNTLWRNDVAILFSLVLVLKKG